ATVLEQQSQTTFLCNWNRPATKHLESANYHLTHTKTTSNATNVRGGTITTPFSNVTGQSCQQLEPHCSDAQNSTVFDNQDDYLYEQDFYSNYRSSTPASNH
ncbi:Uncharacterized protein APZ42_001725, partial [Daphnia magna]